MRYDAADLSHQTVTLDGNEFVGCRFHDSALVFYATGEPYRVTGCRFDPPWRLVWAGEAEQVLKLLSELSQSSAEQASLVNELFDQIRRGQDPRGTLAQLSWERLKVRPAGFITMDALAEWYRQGKYGRGTIETLFADIRSGDFRQLSELKRPPGS